MSTRLLASPPNWAPRCGKALSATPICSRASHHREGSMSILDRRHQLTLLGVGLTITPRALATPQSQDIAQRLLQAQQDGKVDGLHTLLVSRGGELVFEYYGQGTDRGGGMGGARHYYLRPRRTARSAFGVQKPGRPSLRHCARGG